MHLPFLAGIPENSYFLCLLDCLNLSVILDCCLLLTFCMWRCFCFIFVFVVFVLSILDAFRLQYSFLEYACILLIYFKQRIWIVRDMNIRKLVLVYSSLKFWQVHSSFLCAVSSHFSRAENVIQGSPMMFHPKLSNLPCTSLFLVWMLLSVS